MGRMHPHYCEHEKMVDGGSFFEPEDVEGCEICEAAADEYARRATTGYDELASKLNKIQSLYEAHNHMSLERFMSELGEALSDE